ncbi:hypothetical protein PInf_011474 [Phytophthora infestans]|nr:hypothetical protein PInf_011474 [Phytophthora infestans]
METATTKASTAASAGSQGDQLADTTSCESTWTSFSDGITRKGTSSGFRKFREALMAKKFESHDNVPVASATQMFTYLQLQVADLNSVRISEYFDEAFSFIDRALASGGNVLVHCYMGISRSATIILAYLIERRDFSLADALHELRRVRPRAQPNSGFYQELMALETKQQSSTISSCDSKRN